MPIVSGRKLTWVVLVLMAVTTTLIAYCVSVYDRLELTRAGTNQQWRQLADLLDRDYRQLESQLAKESNFSASTSRSERLLQTVDAFRTAVDPHQQRLLADQVEQESAPPADATPEKALLPAASEPLRQQVARFNLQAAEERAILQSPGGRVLRFFLVLPDRQDFELLR